MNKDAEPDAGGLPELPEWDEWDEPEWDADALEALLRATCQADPPRRFALCEEYGSSQALRVFAWGLDSGAGVVLTGERITAGTFRSAERALDIFGRHRALYLYWLDPQPSPGT